MKQFKEWLSDYLRYFLLLLAAILAFFLILAGVKIYQNSKAGRCQCDPDHHGNGD